MQKGWRGCTTGAPTWRCEQSFVAEHHDADFFQGPAQPRWLKVSDTRGDAGDEVRVNRAQLRDLTRQSGFDEDVVRVVADKQGDLKAEMIVLRARQRSEMKALLSDEQRAQLDEVRKGKHFRGHRH